MGCWGCTAPAPVALAVAPFKPDTGTVALRCGALIDGSSDEARRDVTVLIVDGRIARVGDDVRAPRDVSVLDLSGSLGPGLYMVSVTVGDANFLERVVVE